MTFREIFGFEFAGRIHRPSFWLIFATLVVFAFLLLRGNLLAEAWGTAYFLDSPFVVAIVTVAGCLIWRLITDTSIRAARTVQARNDVSASQARRLGGRFLATLACNALILLAVPAGVTLAALSFHVVPAIAGPFRPDTYVAAYAIIAPPSAIVVAVLSCSLVVLRGIRRHLLSGLAVVMALLAVVALVKFKAITDTGGRVPVAPFRIADNLYYVGTADVTAFLLTGPEGDVLIDGGYPGTASLIMANIATLGFDIADVKILLNSHAHFDHAGGLAALQAASGAELWISEGDAGIITSGGVGDPTLGPLKLLGYVGLVRYPMPFIDHRFTDGATIHLGPIALTAHITAGHTPGCTTWSFTVRNNDRELHVVSICSLTLLPGVSATVEAYPGERADFERSFAVLRALPADIFLASHASMFDLARKLRERPIAADPVTPFIDRGGYLDYIDRAERQFRDVLGESDRQIPDDGVGTHRAHRRVDSAADQRDNPR